MMALQRLGNTQVLFAGLVCGFIILAALIGLSVARRRAEGNPSASKPGRSDAAAVRSERQALRKGQRDNAAAARQQRKEPAAKKVTAQSHPATEAKAKTEQKVASSPPRNSLEPLLAIGTQDSREGQGARQDFQVPRSGPREANSNPIAARRAPSDPAAFGPPIPPLQAVPPPGASGTEPAPKIAEPQAQVAPVNAALRSSADAPAAETIKPASEETENAP